VTPYRLTEVYRRFYREYRLHLQGRIVKRESKQISCSLGLQFDTEDGGNVFLRLNFCHSTRRQFPEDGAVHSHRCENLKFHEHVKLSLSLIKHHAIQTYEYGGVEVRMMALLTSALDRGE
jgi:hypothetical protein